MTRRNNPNSEKPRLTLSDQDISVMEAALEAMEMNEVKRLVLREQFYRVTDNITKEDEREPMPWKSFVLMIAAMYDCSITRAYEVFIKGYKEGRFKLVVGNPTS